MRLTKTIKIDDREVTVKEMRTKELRIIIRKSDNKKDPLGMDEVALLTNLTIDEIDNLAPSELKIVTDAVDEVNAAFFDEAGQQGITQTLGSLMQAILMRSYARSSEPDTPK